MWTKCYHNRSYKSTADELSKMNQFTHYARPVQGNCYRLNFLQFFDIPFIILAQEIQGFLFGIGQDDNLRLHVIIPVDMRLIEHRPAGEFLAVPPDEDLHVVSPRNGLIVHFELRTQFGKPRLKIPACLRPVFVDRAGIVFSFRFKEWTVEQYPPVF